MKIYGLKTCDTCRKALKTLENAGHDVSFIDVRATPLTPKELARFLGAFGDALVNTRSTTWRGLSETERANPPQTLLESHPTLMKRPVIEAGIDGGDLYLGWSKSTQEALL